MLLAAPSRGHRYQWLVPLLAAIPVAWPWLLAPLVVFVLWIGLAPQPFIRLIHASVLHLVQQANPAVLP